MADLVDDVRVDFACNVFRSLRDGFTGDWHELKETIRGIVNQ